MKRKVIAACLAIAVLLGWTVGSIGQSVPTGDPLGAAEAAILSAWGGVQSLTCTSSIHVRLSYAGLNLSAGGTGPMIYRKADGKDLVRLQLNGSVAVPAGDITSDLPISFEAASNGKNVYALTSALWNSKAVVGDAASSNGVPLPAIPSLFDALHKNCGLSLQGSSRVNGIDTYVINAVLADAPSADDPLQTKAFRLCFAKDCGALVRVMVFNTAGESVGTLDFTNFKLNVEVPVEQFQFAIPQDAQVYDLRGGKPAKAEYFLPGIPGLQ